MQEKHIASWFILSCAPVFHHPYVAVIIIPNDPCQTQAEDVINYSTKEPSQKPHICLIENRLQGLDVRIYDILC